MTPKPPVQAVHGGWKLIAICNGIRQSRQCEASPTDVTFSNNTQSREGWGRCAAFRLLGGHDSQAACAPAAWLKRADLNGAFAVSQSAAGAAATSTGGNRGVDIGGCLGPLAFAEISGLG